MVPGELVPWFLGTRGIDTLVRTWGAGSLVPGVICLGIRGISSFAPGELASWYLRNGFLGTRGTGSLVPGELASCSTWGIGSLVPGELVPWYQGNWLLAVPGELTP